MIRRVLLGVVLAFVAVFIVGGAGALPARADDPTPGAPPGFTPPPLPDPSDGATLGPTYVITPGVGGSALPAPSDPKAVEKATKGDHAEHHRGATPRSLRPSPVPGGDDDLVTGPQTPLAVNMDHVDRVGILWRGFAGAVLMLVAIEFTIVRRYLLRRRVTAG